MNKHTKKLSKVLIICFLNLLMIQTVFSDTPAEKSEAVKIMDSKIGKLRNKKIPVGKIVKNTESIVLKEITIPTYQCANVSYIMLTDLKQIGANIGWNPETKKTIIYDLNIPINEEQELKFETLKENQMAYLARDTVYINHQEVPAIYADGKAFIPAKWITHLDPYRGNEVFKIAKKDAKWYEENGIEVPVIKGVNIWFDGENYIEEPYEFSLL